MSLETPKEPKKTKTARARELALQYKDLTEHEARTKIMEEIPCSRSTASKAVTWIRKQLEEEKAVKPKLEVVPEEEKKPEFIEKPIEEIKPPPKPIEEIPPTPEEITEQLEIFKNMLRGLHVLIFAEDGLVDLLTKGGVPEDQAKQVSDQLYRWLTRRYPPEELEKFDTILLVASYGTLVGTVVRNIIVTRKKEEGRKKKSTSKKE